VGSLTDSNTDFAPLSIDGLQLSTAHISRSRVNSKQLPTRDREKLASEEHVSLGPDVKTAGTQLEVPTSPAPQSIDAGA
jgi:hypothetical protein